MSDQRKHGNANTLQRIVSWIIADWKRTNLKRPLRCVVAILASPILIPAGLFSLIVVGFFEGLSDGPFPWESYIEHHFYKIWGWYWR